MDADKKQTLESLLRMVASVVRGGEIVRVKPDFRLRVQSWTIDGHDNGDSHVVFSVEPDGHAGDQLYFEVRGNALIMLDTKTNASRKRAAPTETETREIHAE